MTPDDLARALQFAAALLGEAREFPQGARDAAAIDVLAAAIKDGRIDIPPDVWDEIRAAWERAGTGPGPKTTQALLRLLEDLQAHPPAPRRPR